eukprot:m.65428 g.65428  ORF g.65428 m.65428 type:complete len:474 (+) comp8291_c0_seq1:200-1621(+)
MQVVMPGTTSTLSFLGIAVAWSVVGLVTGLDNGLGLTPQMGWSSWNAIGSEVNAEYVKKVADYFVRSGLQDKGWRYINVDEGWMLGRNATTLEPIPDHHAFPEGMDGLGAYIHSRGFKYGLYTSRGTTQCARPEYRARCIHTPPNPVSGCEGTQGYEHQDGRWMVVQGADYIKEDSCGGSQDHATAFADYARMRDVLNATGKPVFFSLCGWNPWYAPPDPSLNYTGGASLGNSWRIHGDGKDWTALSGAVNVMASLTEYTGPGGWNDPDLLIGPTCNIQGVPCGNSDSQARTQFNLWSVFPAPLLISQDVLNWSSYALETYSNTAVIAVNQDPLGKAGIRLQGDDLAMPCIIRSDRAESSDFDNCTNVWGRQLSNGRFALVYVNNALGDKNITCDAECFARLSMPAAHYTVKDLWNASIPLEVVHIHPKGNLPPLRGAQMSHTAFVTGDGSSRMFELTPTTSSTTAGISRAKA